MTMSQALLSLALLLTALPARAQGRCPDDSEPVLTGEPFRPAACLAEPAKGVAVSTAALPDPDAARADLRPLDGTWHGAVAFGGARFDVVVTISGRGKRWLWKALDDRLRIPQQLEVALSRGLFSKPPFTVTFKAAALPGRSLSGQVWLGAAPLEGGQRPPFDRLAVWRFDGRSRLQKAAYAVDGDRLRGVYTLIEPDGEKTSTGFDFTRTAKP